MATGDDALAAGIPIMTGSEQANTLDTEVNLTRDEIARRTSTVMPVGKGGTGSTTAAAARAALGIRASATPSNGATGTAGTDASNVQADLQFLNGKIDTTQGYVDNHGTRLNGHDADINAIRSGNLNSDVYNRTLGGTWRSLYVGSTGLLGWVSSSRRFKKNIKRAVIDVAAVLGLTLVTFKYKVAIDPDGHDEYGLIAEDLHDAGLTWLVDYGDGNTPEGVRYERLALALLPVVQDLASRITYLEELRQ